MRFCAVIFCVLCLTAAAWAHNGKGLTGDPIWIYDSGLYIKHIETALLNDDMTPDVIASEYDNQGYDDPSKVYAIDGSDGSTLWIYNLLDGARSMTIGDINNDGVMDAVVGAGHGSNTPDGRVHAVDGKTGAAIWTYTTNDTNGDLAIGDLNGDEYPDVAVACWDDYVHAIDGSDGSQLWRTYVGSIFLNAVGTGDVNGDEIDDVGYCNEYLAGYDNEFGVLDGIDGHRIWSLVEPYITVDVLIEDIDHDGANEAIFGVITQGDQAYIHVRDALTGELLWEYPLGSCDHVNGGIYLYAQDVDGDDELDLVVGNNLCAYHIWALDAETQSVIWTSETVDGFPADLAFGDVTGDGKLNIVAATYDRVQVLEASNGAKTWYYGVAGTIASVGAGDFDGDGTMDVACAGGAEFSGSDPAKSVWALRTAESPVLWEFDAGEYGSAVAIGNLNGDGYMDVVGVTSDDQAWAIDGKTGGELWHWNGTNNLYSTATGDFDGDRHMDVVVAGYDTIVTALRGSDGGVMWQFATPRGEIGRKCLKTRDLNADGKCDVIAGCDDKNVYAINGETGLELWTSYVGGEVQEVELAQMNGSGPLDVVAAVGWPAPGNKAAVIDGANGEIIWEYTQNTDYTRHVEVFDVNNDHVLDVAIGVPKMGATAGRLIMVDGVTHTALWTVTPFLPCSDYCLSHGDVNGDGVCDLVAAGDSTDKKVHAFSGVNGSELWAFPTGGDVNVVQVADVDRDGELEVAAGSDDQYLYVLNGKDGTKEWEFPTVDDVIHIAIGDISGDGLPNLVCITFGFDASVYAFESLAQGGMQKAPVLTTPDKKIPDQPPDGG
jgi:outer membrane protein assembly factor BamB